MQLFCLNRYRKNCGRKAQQQPDADHRRGQLILPTAVSRVVWHRGCGDVHAVGQARLADVQEPWQPCRLQVHELVYFAVRETQRKKMGQAAPACCPPHAPRASLGGSDSKFKLDFPGRKKLNSLAFWRP